MFQTAVLRTGPIGDMIIALRAKFLVSGPVSLTESERRFLLYALQDTYQTSHSAIVGSQLANQMKFMRPDANPQLVSQISQAQDGTGYSSEFSSNYYTEWQVMLNIMTKLGLAAPPPYVPLVTGPDGDPGGVSTPMHHDINDGTGYNHR